MSESRSSRDPLGGIIRAFQACDPNHLPPPTAPPPNMVSGAFEHMMMFGSRHELTEEELARAIRLAPALFMSAS